MRQTRSNYRPTSTLFALGPGDPVWVDLSPGSEPGDRGAVGILLDIEFMPDGQPDDAEPMALACILGRQQIVNVAVHRSKVWPTDELPHQALADAAVIWFSRNRRGTGER